MTHKLLPEIPLAELKARVGTEIGQSSWFTVTQDMIDRFADLTHDHQFIHVDPVRAAETQFGGTIAHGFLTLSLLSVFVNETIPPIRNTVLGINKGFDRLRFVSPVRTGARIRGRFVLASMEVKETGFVDSAYDVTVEIDGGEKPALAARWLAVTKVDLSKEPS